MDLIKSLIQALEQIKEPRLFNTERGYQGQLKSELDRLLEVPDPRFDQPLVEEEYQKAADLHGIKLRPDLIVHIPFERGVSPTRKHDNFMVVLLKLKATQKVVAVDFEALETICSVLEYPTGVSVNVGANRLHLPGYTPTCRGPFTLVEIAVDLVNGIPAIRTFTRSIQ